MCTLPWVLHNSAQLYANLSTALTHTQGNKSCRRRCDLSFPYLTPPVNLFYFFSLVLLHLSLLLQVVQSEWACQLLRLYPDERNGRENLNTQTKARTQTPIHNDPYYPFTDFILTWSKSSFKINTENNQNHKSFCIKDHLLVSVLVSTQSIFMEC